MQLLTRSGGVPGRIGRFLSAYAGLTTLTVGSWLALIIASQMPTIKESKAELAAAQKELELWRRRVLASQTAPGFQRAASERLFAAEKRVEEAAAEHDRLIEAGKKDSDVTGFKIVSGILLFFFGAVVINRWSKCWLPTWAEQIPEPVRPDDKRIQKLEEFRAERGIPDDVFVLAIMGSPHVTRRLQELTYRKLQLEHPGASPESLLGQVLLERAYAQISATGTAFDGAVSTMEEAEEFVRQRLQPRLTSLDAVTRYLVECDWSGMPADQTGLRDRIWAILESGSDPG